MSPSKKLILPVSAMGALAIFIVDAMTPVGFVVWLLYSPLVLLQTRFATRNRAVLFALVCSVLIPIRLFFGDATVVFSGHSGGIGYRIINKVLGISTIWLVAALGFAWVRIDRARQHLQTGEAQLKAALAAKDEFLSMVSHEMRTPLTAIIGSVALLQNQEMPVDEQEQKEMLAEIGAGGWRLAATIDNMLALARLQLGEKIALEPLPLQKLVDQTLNNHRLRYPHRNLKVHGAIEAVQPFGSQVYVEHVLVNLLENAEKYTPPAREVAVQLATDQHEAVVRVIDQGIGLTPQEAENIFEPFFRSQRISATSPGVGIGLSVCKRLIEEQRGRIWVESPGEGKGTTFAFTLPLVAVDD